MTTYNNAHIVMVQQNQCLRRITNLLYEENQYFLNLEIGVKELNGFYELKNQEKLDLVLELGICI